MARLAAGGTWHRERWQKAARSLALPTALLSLRQFVELLLELRHLSSAELNGGSTAWARWLFEHGVVIELQSKRVSILVRIQLLESTSSKRAQTIDAVDQVGAIALLQRIERGQLVLTSSCANKQEREREKRKK